jgi:hypothetical protein
VGEGDIAGVVRRLEEIDAELPREDGVAYFNRLYLAVTRAIGEESAKTTFHDPAFVTRLDVVFAGRYFAAYDAWRAKSHVPAAWRPLFECREHAWRAPVQFALAGMNAHINHDLPIAIVATCGELAIAPDDGSPAHTDYMTVNAILREVEGRIKHWFDTGLIADIDKLTHGEDNAWAMWSVSEARSLAWRHAHTLWRLRKEPALAKAYEETLSGLVDLAGRGILV